MSVCYLNKELVYVYCMLEGLLFMHYPSMRAIDGQLNRQGQWSNCHSVCVCVRVFVCICEDMYSWVLESLVVKTV